MPKLFIRIAVLLLVPCLIADPVTASAFTYQPSQRPLSCHQLVFNEQALAVGELTSLHPILSVPFLVVLLSAARP